MTKTETLDKIRERGLLAVVRSPSPETTIKIADALVNGGVKGIEVTFTSPQTPEVVAALDAKYGQEILLGMGTLTRPEDVASAQDAGAKFIVSPIYETTLVDAMTASGLPVMVGALTPTEVFQAYQAGSDVVKVFPGSLTGPSYLKAIHGPLSQIPLMPTGGVDIDYILDWFKAGAFAFGAGSQLCPKNLVNSEDFSAISAIARRFMQVVQAAKLQRT